MRCFLFVAVSAVSIGACAQPLHGARSFTRADTLRGSIGPERAWWDALHYDVSVRPDFATKSISGTTIIGFIAKDSGLRMQIDLQQPLIVDSVTADMTKVVQGNFTIVDKRVNTERDGPRAPIARRASSSAVIRVIAAARASLSPCGTSRPSIP